MKKVKSQTVPEEFRPEYDRSDFGEMVRGKYASRVRQATNVVVLDPKVAKAFPNEAAVNKALLSLIEVAQASTGLTPRSTRTGRKPPVGELGW